MSNQPTNTCCSSASGRTRRKMLIVVRETVMCCNECLLETITQTLKQWDHLPGVTDVLALGTDPIQNGKATLPNGKQLQLKVIKDINYRAVLFEHEDVMYLYLMGPAEISITDFDDHSNAFVKLLSEVLEIYRPVHLNLDTFNQLTYSAELMGRLQEAVTAHVDVLSCCGDSIHLDTDACIPFWESVARPVAMKRWRIARELLADLHEPRCYR